MKSLSKFLVWALVVWGANTVCAQGSLKDDEVQKAVEVKNLVNSGRYTFEATRLISNGDNQLLKHRRDLDISKDTLIAYLPEFGKMPIVTGNPEAPGITCTRFDYNMTARANGRWEVTIKPEQKDAADRDVKLLKLDISAEGYGTLTITSNDRKPVEYYGYIMQHSAAFPSNPVAVR